MTKPINIEAELMKSSEYLKSNLDDKSKLLIQGALDVISQNSPDALELWLKAQAKGKPILDAILEIKAKYNVSESFIQYRNYIVTLLMFTKHWLRVE